MKKKIISMIMAGFMVVSAGGFSALDPVYAGTDESGNVQVQEEIQSWDDVPEADYNKKAARNIIRLIYEYVEPYLGTDTLNNYENGRAIQCHAFTNYVWRNVFGFDVYSGKSTKTPASTDYANLANYIKKYARPGDMLRVDGKHSMIITGFDRDSVWGYDWLVNKKERACTYTWEGVKKWGDGSQNYFLFQINDSIYEKFEDEDYKMPFFGPLPKGTEEEEAVETEKDSKVQEPEAEKQKEELGKIVVQVGNPVMTVNEDYINIDDSGTVPVIVGDRVLLPIRAVVQAMGGDVSWDNDKRQVIVNQKGHNLVLTIDSTVAIADGKSATMDVAPVIIGDRTMVPVRFVSESLDCQVQWFDSIQAAQISYRI